MKNQSNYKTDQNPENLWAPSLSNALKFLRCPADRGSLDWRGPSDAPGQQGLPDGAFICQQCERLYPAADGVARFMDDTVPVHGDADLKLKEMRARDEEAKAFDQESNSFRKGIEQRAILRVMGPRANDLVAELGCGTGQLTVQYAPLVQAVAAIDFSVESLKLLAAKVPPSLRDRVILIQADVCNPPLRLNTFTKAVTSQVWEHLPSPTSRQQATTMVSKLLAPGGLFVCTVYNWSRQKQRDAAAGDPDSLKEGFHQGRIYYYCFDDQEFAELLKREELTVEFVKGIATSYRGAGWLGSLAAPIDDLIATTRLGAQHGHLLLAKARRMASQHDP